MQATSETLQPNNFPSALFKGGRSLFQRLTANKKMAIGSSIITFFVLLAIFGPLLTHQSPDATSNDIFLPPSLAHWLGTTKSGEDVFTQLVYGARVSLLVGFLSALGSIILQIIMGLSAGYFGGLIDNVLSFIINVFLVLPGIPLGLVIASFAPLRGSVVITLLLIFTSWSYGSRVLRAQTLSMRNREFVEAARSSGETTLRIIFFEILPNEIALVASSFIGTFVYTILADVVFEFLGLGDVTKTNWGVMLYWAQAGQALLAGGWWWFIPPGLCVALVCAGLTLLNSGIDEVANPKLRTEPKTEKLARKKQAEIENVNPTQKEVVVQ
ncbi:hypothetical protein KDA_39400 [Dictyobacter alpinus]|uniref:ABC transmembrane type-1 domain-containing protein n=1 Tax=Dictyobacter alpinus TaxID=2014873 RepID=A0A402BAX1_9CHLR|nr:ABC transporter permease [Dictyobacter alpinus]GCE28456.1 hypothetical protein KDA_39400 [Dictyobacter alpinus]